MYSFIFVIPNKKGTVFLRKHQKNIKKIGLWMSFVIGWNMLYANVCPSHLVYNKLPIVPWMGWLTVSYSIMRYLQRIASLNYLVRLCMLTYHWRFACYLLGCLNLTLYIDKHCILLKSILLLHIHEQCKWFLWSQAFLSYICIGHGRYRINKNFSGDPLPTKFKWKW